MKPLSVGVVGVGRLGTEHARILADLPGCQLAGVHDVDAARARSVAERLASVAFDSLEELIRASDALIVAVPTRSHHPVAARILESGRHVLVEKPLAPTLAEADELVELAEREGVWLAVGHVERFNPVIRAVRPLVHDPRFLWSERLAPFQPRGTDVTVMLDLMIHDIDLALGVVGRPVASVQAVGVPVLTDRVDMANARIVFDNGAVAEINASRVSKARTRRLRMFQASGYFTLDLGAGEGEYLRRRDGDLSGGLRRREEAGTRYLDDLVERIRIRGEGTEPLRLELGAFRDTIRGRSRECVSARDGRAALDVALRIEREIERSAHVSAQDP